MDYTMNYSADDENQEIKMNDNTLGRGVDRCNQYVANIGKKELLQNGVSTFFIMV